MSGDPRPPPHRGLRLRSGVCACAGLLGATAALARDPLQPGADIKSHAAIGVVVGDDPSALFYNPANLAAGAGDEASSVGFSELTVTGIRASYNHPGFAPFVYNAVAPLAAAGGAYRLGDRLSLGLVAFPSGVNSAVAVDNLPVDVLPGQAGEAHVRTRLTGYELAVGGSLRVAADTRLGLAVVQTYQHDKIHIDIDGVPQTFDDADVAGTFYKVILGVRQPLGHWTLAASVAPPVVQRYHGTARMPALGFPDPYPVTMTTYSPLTAQLGAAYQAGRLKLTGEYAYEGYAAGGPVTQSGMNPNDSVGANLRNTHNLAVSAEWASARRSTLYAGVGAFPADEGGGLYSGTRGPDDHGEGGMRFGNFGGYDRYGAGAGWRRRRGDLGLGLGGFVNYGINTVPASQPQQGTYTLFLAGVSAALDVAF